MSPLSEIKKESIKAISLSFSGNLMGKIISLPVGIVIASILGPGDYGILAIITLILQYLTYLNLGLLGNIPREVPIAYGKEDLGEVKTIYSTVFTNYIITTIISLFILWFIYALGFDYDGEILIKYMVFITLIKLAANADSYLYTYVKGEGKFIIIGKYEWIKKTILPVINLVMVWYFQLTGLLISLLLLHLIGLVFFWVRLKRPLIKFKFNYSKTVELLRTGIPMFFNKIMDGVFVSIGLIMAGTFLQKVDVGLLSFAMVIASSKRIPFSTIFTMSISREMGIQWGKQGIHNYGHFAKYFGSKLIIYAILMSSILGTMVLFYTVAVKIFLHEFLSSIPIFIILYFALNFYNIRSFSLIYLNVTRQIYKRTLILVLGLLSNIILCYLAVKLGYGVIGIAFAVAVSFIIVSINAIYVTFNQIFVTRWKKYVFLLKLLIISTTLTGLVYFYSDFTFFTFGLDYHNIGDMLLVLIDLLIKVSTFLLLTFVLYSGLFHKDDVYSELKNILDYVIQSVRVKFGF